MFDRDGNTKSLLAIRFGAKSLYQSEIEFSRYFKPFRDEDYSGKIALDSEPLAHAKKRGGGAPQKRGGRGGKKRGGPDRKRGGGAEKRGGKRGVRRSKNTMGRTECGPPNGS